jgi:hypothetical protein
MTNRSKKSYIKYIPPIDISPKPDISGNNWLHFDISGHHWPHIDISCVVTDISGYPHHHNWIDVIPDISGHHHHWPIKPVVKKSKSSTK